MPDEINPNLESAVEQKTAETEKNVEGSLSVEAPKAPEASQEKKESSGESEKFYNKILSKIQTSPSDDKNNTVAQDSDEVRQEEDAEKKINKLIEIAELKGVVHAVKVARHMEDNYTLDEFHDRLLGEELHTALIKKGLIKEL